MADLNTDGKSGGGEEKEEEEEGGTSTRVKLGVKERERERIGQNLFHLPIKIDLCKTGERGCWQKDLCNLL